MKKNKRTGKRLGCLLLTASMLLGLTACGNGESTEVDAEAKNYVFRQEDLTMDTDVDISSINDLTMVGERLYMVGMDYSSGNSFLLSCNPDGSDVQTVEIELPNSSSEGGGVVTPRSDVLSSAFPASAVPEAEAETDSEGDTGNLDDDIGILPVPPENEDGSQVYTDTWINQLTTDGTNLYLLLNTSINDYTDPENPTWSESYSLMALDTAGTELWNMELGSNEANSSSYFYVNDIVGTPSGVLACVQGDEGLVYRLYDTQGNPADEFTLEVSGGSFYTGSEGQVYINAWEDTENGSTQTLREIDLQAHTVSEPISIPGMDSYTLSLCPYVFGGSYDFYMMDNMAVYGYNVGDADKTKILDFVDSDIDNSYMNFLVILDDTSILMTSYDYNDGSSILASLTKVDPADVKDKTVIQLACYGGIYSVRSDVIEFNKSNDQYRIQITDYSSYDGSEDWTAGLTRLNNDIVSGNVPDILIVSSSMPVSSYISKGLFADLYPFIDEDPDMSREDFLPNILEAYSVDGALYQITPSFNIYTMAAKSKFVGSEPGWTMADLLALQPNLPEGMSIFGDITRDSFISNMLYMSSGQFVDWKTGECHFDSQEFIDFLEFANTLPEEIDPSIYEDEDYWMDYDSMYREDRCLLSSVYLNNFRTYNVSKVVTFGEDITLIGYPAAGGNGAAISSDTSYAISAQSENKDGAWAFVRQYLLPEYQETITYNFPIRMDRLETLMEEAKQKPYYLDENGEKVEYDDVYYIGDQEVIVPPMTDAEVNLVRDYILSVTQVLNYDDQLINIVTEEAAAYFAGQRSAAEAAEIIQSRAGIYISENR